MYLPFQKSLSVNFSRKFEKLTDGDFVHIFFLSYDSTFNGSECIFDLQSTNMFQVSSYTYKDKTIG